MKTKVATFLIATATLLTTVVVTDVDCELATTKEGYVACMEELTTAEKEIVKASFEAEKIEISSDDLNFLIQRLDSTLDKLGENWGDCQLVGGKINCTENNILRRIENLSTTVYEKKIIPIEEKP